ncbi:MAG: hypothetical protein AAF587_26295 [Bacteroidota bacterium]
MIDFKDFVPEKLVAGNIFRREKYESLDRVLEQINEWERENPSANIINIETVVLPNIHDPAEEGSEDTSLITGSEGRTSWYQVIRVWYQ